jgi:hypothetical protein
MYRCMYSNSAHLCALYIYSISVDISTYSVESNNIIHPTYYILCRSKNDHALDLFTTYFLDNQYWPWKKDNVERLQAENLSNSS